MSQRQYGRETPEGTPGWVKVMGAFVLLILLLLAVGLLARGHGPRRHLPSGSFRGLPAAVLLASAWRW